MKRTVKASSLDELARLWRKYAKTGDVDLLSKVTEVRRQISIEIFGEPDWWLGIGDLMWVLTGPRALKKCTNAEIHDVWRALGFEVTNND